MKISQIRVIHKACHKRDLTAMEDYLRARGLMRAYRESGYKTMRMYLRHKLSIECINGRLYHDGSCPSGNGRYQWQPETNSWKQIGG